MKTEILSKKYLAEIETASSAIIPNAVSGIIGMKSTQKSNENQASVIRRGRRINALIN